MKDEELRKYKDDRENYDWVKVPKLKTKLEDIRTPKVLVRMNEILYGRGGVYEKLGWEPKPHDSYDNRYLRERSGIVTGVVGMCPGIIGQVKKSGAHKKKLDQNGVMYDKASNKNIQSNGEEFAIGFYNKNSSYSSLSLTS